MSLTAEQILSAPDIVQEEVSAWGGTVWVRGMTGTQRDAFEASLIGSSRGKSLSIANVRARLVAICAVNDEGGRLFTDAQASALGAKSAAELDKVYEVASRLSGIGKKDVDDLKKNSADVSFDASPSDSP